MMRVLVNENYIGRFPNIGAGLRVPGYSELVERVTFTPTVREMNTVLKAELTHAEMMALLDPWEMDFRGICVFNYAEECSPMTDLIAVATAEIMSAEYDYNKLRENPSETYTIPLVYTKRFATDGELYIKYTEPLEITTDYPEVLSKLTFAVMVDDDILLGEEVIETSCGRNTIKLLNTTENCGQHTCFISTNSGEDVMTLMLKFPEDAEYASTNAIRNFVRQITLNLDDGQVIKISRANINAAIRV